LKRVLLADKLLPKTPNIPHICISTFKIFNITDTSRIHGDAFIRQERNNDLSNHLTFVHNLARRIVRNSIKPFVIAKENAIPERPWRGEK
jgi:hypothetical protein